MKTPHRACIACITLLILSFNIPSFNTAAQTDARVTVAIAWSPDGDMLAIGGSTTSGQGAIWLYDDLGAVIDTIYLPGTVVNVSWNRDGARLAARYDTKGGTRLAIWDWKPLKTSTPLVTTEEIRGPSEGDRIEWSPTGRYIAVDDTLSVHIFDTATGNRVAQLYDKERTGTSGTLDIEWTTNEQSVYVLYEDRNTNQILQWNINTAQIIRTVLSEASFVPISMRQSLDSQWLAVSEGRGSVFLLDGLNFEAERELLIHQRVESHIPYVSYLFWLEGNSALLGLADDGSAYLWDTTTGELIAVDSLIPDKGIYMRDVALTPFGGRLAIATTWYPETPTSTPPYAPTKYQPLLLGGMVRVIVPAPSFDRLTAILELCVQDVATPIEPLSKLTAQPVSEATLPTFVASVEALPDDAMLSACRADLLAMADALRSGE